MTLLAPAALGWLLLVLPILALFLLRPRPILVDVPSLLFWEDAVFADRHGQFGLALRRWIVLSLHLLVVFALTLALTQPSLPHGPGSVIFLLDDSATMQTVESSGRTRLDAARTQVMHIVEQLPPDVVVSVVLAGSPPTVAVRREVDHFVVREALDTVRARDVNPRLTQAIALARRLDDSGAGRLFILSDQPSADVTLRSTDRWLTIGSSQPNVGLTGLAIGSDQASIDVSISRAGAFAASADVTILVGDRAVAKQSVLLNGVGSKLNIPVTLAPGTSFRVQLSPTDSFSLDNSLYGVWPARSTKRPLVVGDRGDELAAALGAPDDAVRSSGQNDWDFVGFDAVFLAGFEGGPGRPIPGHFVVFGGKDPFGVVANSGPRMENVTVTQWKPGSLMLKGVDMLPWRIRKLAGLRAPHDAETIAAASDAPLIFVVRRSVQTKDGAAEFHAIYVNFELLDSNVPSCYGFATLVPNMLEYFEDADRPNDSLFQLTGAPLTFKAPRDKLWEVRGPTHEILGAYLQGGRLIVPTPTQAGFHRTSSATGSVTQAVNYLAEHVTALPSGATATLGTVGSSLWWGLPPWMLAAFVAGTIVFIELLLTGSGLLSTE